MMDPSAVFGVNASGIAAPVVSSVGGVTTWIFAALGVELIIALGMAFLDKKIFHDKGSGSFNEENILERFLDELEARNALRNADDGSAPDLLSGGIGGEGGMNIGGHIWDGELLEDEMDPIEAHNFYEEKKFFPDGMRRDHRDEEDFNWLVFDE